MPFDGSVNGGRVGVDSTAVIEFKFTFVAAPSSLTTAALPEVLVVCEW